MKKISLLITILALATSFSIPVATSAVGVDGACDDTLARCDSGLTCSLGKCSVVGVGPGNTGNTGNAGNSGTGGTPGSINQTYLTYYYTLILTIINSYLVPILIAIAFIVFLYGVYEYFILGAAEEDKRKEGRQFVLWGVIGFVIIVSIWSIVNIVQSTVIPAGQNNRPTYPTL